MYGLKKTCYLLLCHAVVQRTQWIQGWYARAKHPKEPENRTGKALSLSLNTRRCAVSLRRALSACLCLTTIWDSFKPDNSHHHQRGKQLYYYYFFFFFYKGCVALYALPAFCCQTSGSLTSRLVCAVVNQVPTETQLRTLLHCIQTGNLLFFSFSVQT